MKEEVGEKNGSTERLMFYQGGIAIIRDDCYRYIGIEIRDL